MKAISLIPGRRRRAFSIPELMVALSVFTFVVVGITFAHLYGLTMFRVTSAAITTTAAAREAAAEMTEEIRTSNRALIGNVKNGNFVALLNGERQEGGGLAIYPTANPSNFVIYFVNPENQTFQRATHEPGSLLILAESVTNTVVFRAQNHRGQVQTNQLNNRVIHYNLEFYQPRRYKQGADYFKLESAVTRRAD